MGRIGDAIENALWAIISFLTSGMTLTLAIVALGAYGLWDFCFHSTAGRMPISEVLMSLGKVEIGHLVAFIIGSVAVLFFAGVAAFSILLSRPKAR